MKTWLGISCAVVVVVGLGSCNKTSVDPTVDGSARSSSVVSSSSTGPSSLTAVDVANLPATVTNYITTNYTGATIKEARKDAQGNFVVAITINNTSKLLLFKADGTFVREGQRKPNHTPGDSTHHRTPGDSTRHRAPGDSTHPRKPAPSDSTHRPRGGDAFTDVAVSSLPAVITSYVTTNYAGATINKAAQATDTSEYAVSITTADSKRVVLLFASDGTFKKALTRR